MRKLALAIAAVTVVVASGLVTTGGAVTSKPLVAVHVDEFSVFPRTQGAPKGKVTFVVTNIGTLKHEFVVLKTTKPAGNLLKGNEADETRQRRRDRRGASGPGEDAEPYPQAGALLPHLQSARPLQDRSVRGLLRPVDRATAQFGTRASRVHIRRAAGRIQRPRAPPIHSAHAEVRDLGNRDLAVLTSVGRDGRAEFERDGFARVDDIADADFVLNMFDAERAEGVPARSRAARTRPRSTSSRRARGRAQDELPDARAHARERRRPARSRRGRLVHDDGARHLQDLGRAARGVRAARTRSRSRSS